jgi:hypothetical protein
MLAWLCLRGSTPRAGLVVVRLFVQPLLISLPAFVAAALLHRACGAPGLWTDMLAVGLIGPVAMIVSVWFGYCLDADLQMIFKRLWRGVLQRLRPGDV